MSGWTALVPLKISPASKSRLGAALAEAARIELVSSMARHVLATLEKVPEIDRIVVLSANKPDWWNGDWSPDQTGSLNPALEVWRKAERPERLLVIHGDLPFVQPDEIATLLAAAQLTGAALATDGAGLGTNALALCESANFVFQFGPDSRTMHTASQSCQVLELPGLARDIDEPADLSGLYDMIRPDSTG